MESNFLDKKPIIFIMGTSAVGKTKLSLALANILNRCEIVNCDSMQIYKDASIMTAKATIEEQTKIKHHLLDILDLSVNDFTRSAFIKVGLQKIDELLKAEITPIVVGGTHYYIEGLLFRDSDLIESSEKDLQKPEDASLEDYNKLREIDPIMANKIHPEDKRKIRNYLQLYYRNKMKPSDIIKKCESEKELRYKNSIILWPFMEKPEVLREKARLRIEEMANSEGIQEILNVYEFFCSEISEINEIEKKLDFTRGVLQAIGYKEFFPFYIEIKKLMIKLNLNLKNEKELDDLLGYIQTNKEFQDKLSFCKERLLMKTIKYTKKQLLWIENRLIPLEVLKGKVFKFVFSNYGEFDEKVLLPACSIIQKFKETLAFDILQIDFGKYVPEAFSKGSTKRTSLENWQKYTCEICAHEFNGPKEWEIHLVSRGHSKKKQKRERKDKVDYFKKMRQAKEAEKNQEERKSEEIVKNETDEKEIHEQL